MVRKSKPVPSSRVRTDSIAPSYADMPWVTKPPSKAGPAGHDAANIFPSWRNTTSVLVPISTSITVRSSSARSVAKSVATMPAAASAPT